MPDKPHPIIFIHGLWLHKSSWVPWESMFEQSGYRVLSPSWPGDRETVELARANPDSVADRGIDDVVEHFASIIGGLDSSPVLIGHSFGGMIAEKLLGQDRAAAAIAIDAAQIKGVLPLPLSSLRATLPVFKNPANRHRAVMLTAEQFRYSFGNAADRRGVSQALRKVGSASAWQAALRGGSGQLLAPLARPRWTHGTRAADRSSSSWAVKITPFPKRLPNRR